MKTKFIQVEVGVVRCNECIFYRTWDPDPEECTGFGGFRKYWCALYDQELRDEIGNSNIPPFIPGDDFKSTEYEVKPCTDCKASNPWKPGRRIGRR